jgi:dethiobiotin synthetase
MSVVLVTGTDTDVGKTLIMGALAGLLRRQGLNVGVFKPVQSGVAPGSPESDSARLKWLARLDVPEKEICPRSLEQPLAPMMAARLEKARLSPKRWEKKIEALSQQYELLFVEGAGGITVPLAKGYSVSTMAERFRMPALVVARPGLGTVNHILLTVEYAKSRGIPVLGVILNGWGRDGKSLAEITNLDLLGELLDVPVLGRVPWINKIQKREAILNVIRNYVKVNLLLERIEKCTAKEGARKRGDAAKSRTS